jgi:hypothetical protein
MQTLHIDDASMKEADLALLHVTICHHMQGMMYAGLLQIRKTVILY